MQERHRQCLSLFDLLFFLAFEEDDPSSESEEDLSRGFLASGGGHRSTSIVPEDPELLLFFFFGTPMGLSSSRKLLKPILVGLSSLLRTNASLLLPSFGGLESSELSLESFF